MQPGAAEAAPGSVLELYQDALRRRGFAADASQHAAVARLQRLYEEWSDYKRRRRTALHRLLVRPPLPRGGQTMPMQMTMKTTGKRLGDCDQ